MILKSQQRRLSRAKTRRRVNNRLRLKALINIFPFKRIIKFLLMFSPIALIVFIVWLIPHLVLISEIDCKSQFGPCSGVLDGKLKVLKNQNYADIKWSVDKIMRTDYLVDKYSIRLTLPSVAHIYAIERKPEVAVVSQKNTSNFAYVDQDGLVLFTTDKTSLPILLLNQDLDFNVGHKLEVRILFATQILSQVYKVYNIKLATAGSDGVQIEMQDGTMVIFPLEGELDVIFGSLNLILSRLNSTSTNSRIEEVLKVKPSIIDLRYKNPVLK